ncbi:hypothetical protein PABG_05541 [Paracoccidioides brasiliensis Pb03]|nr:hypothetical protein PABG_05541 [Paracoccidioides brasiliensis Pb03]
MDVNASEPLGDLGDLGRLPVAGQWYAGFDFRVDQEHTIGTIGPNILLYFAVRLPRKLQPPTEFAIKPQLAKLGLHLPTRNSATWRSVAGVCDSSSMNPPFSSSQDH